MDFKNKIVVITGAAKGIGAACAELFHRSGARVALLDIAEFTGVDVNPALRDNIPLRRNPVATPHGGTAPEERRLPVYCDVASEESVQAAFKEVHSAFGGVDFLVNNAGIQHYGKVTETTGAEWDQVMNVNLKSLFLCAKYAIPYMQERKKGVIINVSSVQAFVSQQQVAAYTTAKTAILGLTRSIAVDYAPAIRCVAVCPGSVDTPMLRESVALSPNPEEVMQECMDMHVLKRIGRPEEVAGLIAFLCGDHASFITGQAIRIDGGLGITIPGSKRG